MEDKAYKDWLKAQFSELEEEAPSFEEVMNRKRERRSGMKKFILFYSVAASVVLIIGIALWFTFQSEILKPEKSFVAEASDMQLEWEEEILPEDKETFQDISEWNSPTDFLIENEINN
jgi:hypothetical protein